MNQQRVKIIRVLTVSAVIFLVLLFSALILNFINLAQANSKKANLEKQLIEMNRIIEANADEITYKTSNEFYERYGREERHMHMIGDISYTGKTNNN